MKPHNPPRPNFKSVSFLTSRLDQIIDMRHPIVLLSKSIPWEKAHEEFGQTFKSHRGRPALPVRLMIGLMMMSHTEDLSDDETVKRWLRDPYWQYFCGMEYFQHTVPIHPSSMSRWRKHLGEAGFEKVLQMTVQIAKKTKVISAHSVKQVNVDTTVQEKAITYPTDSKLMYSALKRLVTLCKKHNIPLRQSYLNVGKKSSIQAARYAHAKQFKRMKGELKFLRTRLGRVIRDIERTLPDCSLIIQHILKEELALAQRIHTQQPKDKKKLYSLHRPETECISKGKAHKRYEFGCKASFVTTNKEGFILGAQALHNNPFDGHTLKAALHQAETIAQTKITHAFVDKGYKGHACEHTEVILSGRRNLSRHFKKKLNRRSHIEASIGHMKNDGKLNRNWLKGVEGDKNYALLCAIGQNMRLLLAFFYFCKKIRLIFGQFWGKSTESLFNFLQNPNLTQRFS